MKGEDTTYRDAIGDVEMGWAPWVLAATYFPVYIVLDFVFGSRIADEVGLLQSVAVGVVSLTISAFVVLLFVLESIRRAARPRHGLGSSRGRLGRGLNRLFAPLTGAVLTAFVLARDGVAMLLEAIWRVTAAVVGAVRAVVGFVGRPVVFLGALAARPLRAVTSGAAGALRSDAETSEDDVEPAVDRTGSESGPTASPVERAQRESAEANGTSQAAETPGAAGTTGAEGASRSDEKPEDGEIAAPDGAAGRAGADEAPATAPTADASGDAEDDEGETRARRAGKPGSNGGMVFPARSAADRGSANGDGTADDRVTESPSDEAGTVDGDATGDGSTRSTVDGDGGPTDGDGGPTDGDGGPTDGDGGSTDGDGEPSDDTETEWPDEWVSASDVR